MNSANQLSNSSLCVVVMFPPKTSALCERVRNDRSCRENEVLDPVYPLPCLPSWSKPLSYRKLPINSAWMTSKISVAMRDRDYHHRKARKSGSAYHWHMFRNLRNFVNKDIKASKSKYYINFIKESKGNASKIWNAVNEASYRKSQSAAPSCIISNEVQHTEPKVIAAALNEHFATVGQTLADRLSSFVTKVTP